MGSTLEVEASRSFAPPSVLPDISPTRGEMGRPLYGRLFCGVDDWQNHQRQAISPLAGEMSGRTEGGNVERQFLPTQHQAR
jgi:hypothetical protein